MCLINYCEYEEDEGRVCGRPVLHRCPYAIENQLVDCGSGRPGRAGHFSKICDIHRNDVVNDRRKKYPRKPSTGKTPRDRKAASAKAAETLRRKNRERKEAEEREAEERYQERHRAGPARAISFRSDRPGPYRPPSPDYVPRRRGPRGQREREHTPLEYGTEERRRRRRHSPSNEELDEEVDDISQMLNYSTVGSPQPIPATAPGRQRQRRTRSPPPSSRREGSRPRYRSHAPSPQDFQPAPYETQGPPRYTPPPLPPLPRGHRTSLFGRHGTPPPPYEDPYEDEGYPPRSQPPRDRYPPGGDDRYY